MTHIKQKIRSRKRSCNFKEEIQKRIHSPLYFLLEIKECAQHILFSICRSGSSLDHFFIIQSFFSYFQVLLYVAVLCILFAGVVLLWIIFIIQRSLGIFQSHLFLVCCAAHSMFFRFKFFKCYLSFSCSTSPFFMQLQKKRIETFDFRANLSSNKIDVD